MIYIGVLNRSIDYSYHVRSCIVHQRLNDNKLRKQVKGGTKLVAVHGE